LRRRVFRGRDAVSAGLLSPDALRSRAWRRLYQGVYADADLPDDLDVRIAGAALLLPERGVFSGRTAAHLFGAELALPEGPIEVTVPPGVRFGPMAGIGVRCAPLPSSDVTVIAHRRCTSQLRTALDLARFEPMVEAVVALDVLLGRRMVFLPHLEEALSCLAPGRGTRRARRAVSLADARAESPQESRLRVLLVLAGLTPTPQFTVRDSGGAFVARVDLAFAEQRVAIEYDGAWHGRPGQLAKDRRRLNALQAAGWTVFHVTAADLYDAVALIERIRTFLASREIREVGH
jgi:very-short-patch-repair endonuclease